jgi:hypothetical protein
VRNLAAALSDVCLQLFVVRRCRGLCCEGIHVLFASTAQPCSPRFTHTLAQLHPDGSLHVRPREQGALASAVARVQGALDQGRYLQIPFTTLFEYLAVSCFWAAAPSEVVPGNALLQCYQAELAEGLQRALRSTFVTSGAMSPCRCTCSTCMQLPRCWPLTGATCSSIWPPPSRTSSCPGLIWWAQGSAADCSAAVDSWLVMLPCGLPLPLRPASSRAPLTGCYSQ